MTRLAVTGVSASYGDTEVLHGVDLVVESGSATAILGASGCGKTTLLRVIAGFHTVDAGEVRIGERVVLRPGYAIPPEGRGIGYLSQEGNLFPHLTVAGNITFGLPRRKRRDTARVAELLDLVGLPAGLADRRPEQLSGGQQQRVALARALARRPGLVLLDEPFSSLDAGLRVSTRRAVADALAATGATVLLVTHDQGEALSFADQVAIMRDGRFVQVGPPKQVYSTPADRTTAGVLGDMTVIPGEAQEDHVATPLGSLPLADGGATGPVDVALRPEQILIGAPRPGAAEAVVDTVDYFGHDALVRLVLRQGGTPVLARVLGDESPALGQLVGLQVRGPARAFTRPHGRTAATEPS
ncbi:ABC transporter ATP-binding protein [Actinomadura sp.]|jgi:iron(III) transport system ATP-binding protein|uniref:ABC transporter ATP-binding protein n=1 Tax=Actinomadura sp. TaxID=1989 RepID=UPI00335F01A1